MTDFIPHGALGTDPNLFALSWMAIIQMLTGIVILSLVVERALSTFYETAFFVDLTHRRTTSGLRDLKPLIAYLVSTAICLLWGIDAISVIFLQEHSTVLGCLITGAVVAGGSKASLKLFRDILDVQSGASRSASENEARRFISKVSDSSSSNENANP